MKTNVQKLIGMAVLGLTLFSNSIPAWAGQKNSYQVVIKDFTNDSSAGGTTAGARYSSDTQQYIGCNLLKSGSGPAVLCAAQDKTGKYLFCTGYSSKWAAVVKGITDFSYIVFTSAKGNGNCTNLEVHNSSVFLK